MSGRHALLALVALAGCASARRERDGVGPPPAVRSEERDGDDEAREAVRSTPCGALRSERRCLVEGLSALGVDRGEAHFEERPPHAVRVPRLVIDRREVSLREWRRCVRAGRCPEPSCAIANEREPVRCVNWEEAQAYCGFRRGRLPSEAEWERAARGLLPSARRYPWGDEVPDGGDPEDRTDEGVQDLAGGVAEWTADGGDFYPELPPLPDAGPDASSDAALDAPPFAHGLPVWEDARGPAASPWRVVRGGDPRLPVRERTSTLRRFRRPDDRLPWVGLRCVYAPS